MDPEAARTVPRVRHGGISEEGVLDFSANINPAVPSGVLEVYADAFESARSYPPEPPTEYAATAAEYVDCDPKHVVPTPGGLAAIRLTLQVCTEPGASVVIPYPSFGEYEREVLLAGCTPHLVPHDEVFSVDPTEHDFVIVCNPNNPTGDAYDHDRLRDFADRCRGVETGVLVDEAFLGFTAEPSLAGRNGVVVARSLTKLFGLPGIRAGFAVATGEQQTLLAGGRRTWNMGAPALHVGRYCMRQREFITQTRSRVTSERQRMGRELSTRFRVYPSDAPFLLVDVGQQDVTDLLERAREQGVVLRDGRTFHGLDSHVRIAVRQTLENDRLLEALERV